jgi:hypothetical protein
MAAFTRLHQSPTGQILEPEPSVRIWKNCFARPDELEQPKAAARICPAIALGW